MSDTFTVGSLYPGKVSPAAGVKAPKAAPQTTGPTFREVLDKQVLSFSQHAQSRLQERGIRLNDVDMNRIDNAVAKAAAKGAKDSLIMFDQVALIVNVPNKTVITALDEQAMKDHVFTQIDSAVIVPRS